VLGGRDGDAAVQRTMEAWPGFGALHRADDDEGDDVGPEDETVEGAAAPVRVEAPGKVEGG